MTRDTEFFTPRSTDNSLMPGTVEAETPNAGSWLRWNVIIWLMVSFYTSDIVAVQSLSQVQLFVTLQTAARQASLSFTISWSLLTFMSIESMMPSNHLILCCRHYLLEFAHIYVHWVNDAIQPSHPLLPPSPPAFNLSQHQGLLRWISSSHPVASVLELQLQH